MFGCQIADNFVQYVAIDTVVCSIEVNKYLVDVNVELPAFLESLFHEEESIYCRAPLCFSMTFCEYFLGRTKPLFLSHAILSPFLSGTPFRYTKGPSISKSVTSS